MTTDELRKRFPNASATFLAANSGKDSVVERAAGHESLAKNTGQTPAASRLHIRFVSVRKRLCDPDNLSAKWLLDCLRYCRIIDGDEPDKITLEVSQRKAVKGEPEETVITVSKMP